MSYLILSLYLLVTLLLGIIGYRQQKNTPDDYFLADRNINPVVLFFTLIATNLSAFFFLGFAGASYRIGLSYYPMMSFGTAIIGLSFYFIGYKTWLLGKQKGFITPGELIEDRFQSKSLKLLVLAVMVIFTIPYLALQPIGAGYLLEGLTNGQIPYFLGAALLTFVIVLYVFLGGMRSVALTDVLQGILMFVFMLAAVVVIARSLGGFEQATQTVYDLKPELFSRQGADNSFTPRTWFSFLLLWVLSVPMFPQMFMRFYTAKNAISLKLSAILYPLVTAILILCPVLIGLWGHIGFSTLSGQEADRIFPLMLSEYTPPWFAAFVIVGALAAFMSTLDSVLLALSSMLTRDLYIPYFRPQASLQEQTLIGKVLIILLAVIGLIVAANKPDTILAIVKDAFTGLAVLFPTVIAALYGKNVPPIACILSICAGEVAAFGFQFNLISKELTFGFLPVVPVVALSSFVILVGAASSKLKRV